MAESSLPKIQYLDSVSNNRLEKNDKGKQNEFFAHVDNTRSTDRRKQTSSEQVFIYLVE